jgi:hypothetical protein
MHLVPGPDKLRDLPTARKHNVVEVRGEVEVKIHLELTLPAKRLGVNAFIARKNKALKPKRPQQIHLAYMHRLRALGLPIFNCVEPCVRTCERILSLAQPVFPFSDTTTIPIKYSKKTRRSLRCLAATTALLPADLIMQQNLTERITHKYELDLPQLADFSAG